jgi:hypothetical protein
VARAKSAAEPKSVGVHGAQTIQQCLDAGLLDEIHIDLAAVLLGAGVRLFDHLANTPVVLGNPTVVTGLGVTHLRYPCTRRRPSAAQGTFLNAGPGEGPRRDYRVVVTPDCAEATVDLAQARGGLLAREDL